MNFPNISSFFLLKIQVIFCLYLKRCFLLRDLRSKWCSRLKTKGKEERHFRTCIFPAFRLKSLLQFREEKSHLHFCFSKTSLKKLQYRTGMKTRKSFWETGLSSKCYSPGEGPPEGKPISLCCTEGRNIVGMRKLEERERKRES